MFHDDISKRYDSLIVDIVEEQYISTESGIISYKAKLKLKGNSSLRIREIWEKQNLLKYSYYWLNSDNQLIIGWDNAPHHKHVKSFPHHKHYKRQSNIKESNTRNLSDVLSKIEEYYSEI